MRKGGGKQKGSAFERLICKDLSMWITNGEQKDVFWRSAMSGGRSTVAMKRGDKLAAQAGDVSSVHRLGHAFIDQFMVECKAYKTLNFESFIKGKGHLLGFWEHARNEAKTYGKFPLLIGKQNNYPVVACLDSFGVNLLKAEAKVKIIVTQSDLYIMLWDDFLKLKFKPSKRVRL